MRDLLKEILEYEEDTGALDFKKLPQYRPSMEKLDICYKKAHKALGFHFVDALTDAELERRGIENLACFRHGFHLAGQLLLELFSARP